MKALSTWILVVALALAASCISGKRGPRGTNVGTGSNGEGDGPWNEGGPTHALHETVR